MVKINNQRKAFPRYAGVVGETDNGRQKTRNHGYDVVVAEALLLITPITLPNLSRSAKLKSTGAGRYSFFPLVGMPTASSLA